jgi:hypothetical protein
VAYKVLEDGVERDATHEEAAEIEARKQQASQVVPAEVSRRRGLEALFKMYGLKDADIEASIAQHITDPDDQYVALNEFRTAQTFEYDRQLVVLMCHVLSLDRPALFIFADSLP